MRVSERSFGYECNLNVVFVFTKSKVYRKDFHLVRDVESSILKKHELF